jgi:hypothetical protein
LEVVLAIAVCTGIALALLHFAARAAVTVCVLEVIDGKARTTRGGIAPRVLADIQDVVARPPVRHARIRIVRARGRARLEVRGALSQAQRQQLRNVVGTVPLAKLANTTRRKR